MTAPEDWYVNYRREVEAAYARRKEYREITSEAAKWVLCHVTGGAVDSWHWLNRHKLSPIGKAWVRKIATEKIRHKRLMESAWGETP